MASCRTVLRGTPVDSAILRQSSNSGAQFTTSPCNRPSLTRIGPQGDCTEVCSRHFARPGPSHCRASSGRARLFFRRPKRAAHPYRSGTPARPRCPLRTASFRRDFDHRLRCRSPRSSRFSQRRAPLHRRVSRNLNQSWVPHIRASLIGNRFAEVWVGFIGAKLW